MVGNMIYQSSLSPLIKLLFRLLSFSALVKAATSSSGSSRGRYAAYDYDLTTPQYTPDGRLLQVEYATNACRGGSEGRSNPIVCVGMSIPSQRDVLSYAKRQDQRRRKQQQLKESGGQRNNSELECTDDNGEDSFSEVSGDALLIMATISSPPPSSSTSLIVDSKHKTDGDNKMDKQSSSSITEQQSNYINQQQRTQCRIIEVPLSTSFQTQYYGKTSSTTTESSSILIGLSGILADATSLLQIAYSVLEEEQISFGWHRLGLSPVGTTTVPVVGSNDSNDDVNLVTKSHAHPRRQQHQQQTATAAQPSETTVRLARAIGDKCQKHAFGGGLRPLGASLMIAGIEQQQQQGGVGSGSSIKLAMCETEPSGAVSVINPFWVTPTTSTTTSSAKGDVGNSEDKLVINSPRVMVSGGATQSQSQSKLKQTMTLRVRKLYDDIIMNSEKEEARERVIYSEEVFLKRALQTVIEALVEEWKGRGSIPSLSGDNSKRGEQPMVLPQMEVVFTTPKRGTYRLSENDIRVLMENTEK
jgi:hypothetical protein